jgi:peptidoglycan/xylan/chitin deacetylase (PgdA/CDA1 family)
VGNHTHNHLDGWKVSTEPYVKNIELAAAHISSTLFRPPYGKMTRAQFSRIREIGDGGLDVIMWDVLSGDFDASFSPQRCLRNVTRNARSGSIIVFHDSEKAYHNLFAVLPQVLQFLTEKGYVLDRIGDRTSGNN